MIAAIIKSSLILLIILGAARLMHRQSAAVRHMIWTAGLMAAISAPIASFVLPSWTPVTFTREAGRSGDHPPLPGTVLSDTTSASQAGAAPSSAVVGANAAMSAAQIAFTVWAAGLAIAVAILAAGAARVRRLVHRAQPVTSDRWVGTAAGIAHTFRLKRGIRLLWNRNSPVLGTWGFFRGTILIPHDAESWPDERIRIVLAHELAHVKRMDWIVQITAEAARAICWFNPLFWIACRRLRLESECACDDAVLNLGIDGQTYAAHLLELARSLKNPHRAWPVLAMAERPHLERRFIAMLNPSLNRRSLRTATLVAAVIGTIFLTLPLAALQTAEIIVPAPPLPAAPALAAVSPAAAPAAPAAVVSTAPATPTARALVPAPAQEPSASISGTISDASGAVVPGTGVTLLNVDARSEQKIVSNDVGFFQFFDLPAGRYLVQAQLPGFQTFNSRLIELQGNEIVRENVTLVIGTFVERVAVLAAGTPRAVRASETATPRRIRVGGNIRAPNLVSEVKPIYPQSARDAGVEGRVRLQGVIGSDGSILSLAVLNEGQVDPELASAARGAVSQWRYRPTLLNGTPIEVITTIEVNFRLTQ